jgi:hypothetical protein
MHAAVPVAWQPGAMDTATDELLDITCPRCEQPVSVRFYGPCEGCRDLLRAEQAGTAREVEVAAYEPKMNVTPNAVALKE